MMPRCQLHGVSFASLMRYALAIDAATLLRMPLIFRQRRLRLPAQYKSRRYAFDYAAAAAPILR